MCIVAIAWQVLDETPLCLISNRDEFYHRAASQIHEWENSPIIAGQDLQSGGTWMGITAAGRWALVTNYRDANDKKEYPTSRGHIIQQYLESELTPIRFAQELEKKQCDYAGFNLFIGTSDQAVYMSNRGESPQVLAKGLYVVSNGVLSDPWEKTKHLRKRFTQEFLPLLQLNPNAQKAYDLEYAVWDILQDERKIDLDLLPQTGISVEMEQLLSSTFIRSPIYGTRCSNYLLMKRNQWTWLEKTQQGKHQNQIVKIDLHLSKKMPTS